MTAPSATASHSGIRVQTRTTPAVSACPHRWRRPPPVPQVWQVAVSVGVCWAAVAVAVWMS